MQLKLLVAQQSYHEHTVSVRLLTVTTWVSNDTVFTGTVRLSWICGFIQKGPKGQKGQWMTMTVPLLCSSAVRSTDGNYMISFDTKQRGLGGIYCYKTMLLLTLLQ